MIDATTQQKVLAILNKVSGGKATNINLDNDLKSEVALDSIQIVELFAALEKEFEVELPLQLMNVKSGKDFMETLGRSLMK
jgi:acyl carrier protein